MVCTPHTGSTEYKRGSRDQSRPMAGSPRIIARAKPPDRRQPAAVLALVKDKPSAALKKRRP
jgi:hypothetical protein